MFLFHKSQTKREAFGQMFTEMYPRMVRYATQLMGDREEARDIVSEVMEQAWKHFEQLNKNDRGGWIYTAVRNNCLNRLKHLQVEQENVKALYEATLADVENNYREHEALLQKRKRLPEVCLNQLARYFVCATTNILPTGKSPGSLVSVPTQ